MKPGERVHDRYTIDRELGRGGFAVTYLATDAQTGKPCVIKALSLATVDDWQTVERFERESRVLAHLDHPRIPRCRDSFTTLGEGGRLLCLVQDYVRGTTLAEAAAAGQRFMATDVLRIALDVADILAYLHGLSPPIIHRDIKPSNVIVGPDQQAHLIDFGAVRDVVARDRQEGGGSDTVVGTYGYMPFEQFAGRALPASDVYALGATLLFLLTGRDPASLKGDGDRLDFRRQVTVAPAFADVLEQMTDPDWSRRFQNGTDLREALLQVRQGTRPRRAKPRAKPARALWAVLAVLAAGGIWAATRPRAPQPYTVEDHAPRKGGSGARQADGLPRPNAPTAVRLDANLLGDPGFDAGTWWQFRPTAEGRLVRDPDTPGNRCLALIETEDEVYQDIDVQPLREAIGTGTCAVTFAARLRSAILSDVGNPYLHGLAMREMTTGWKHLSGFSAIGSTRWQWRSQTWDLPRETRYIRFELHRSNRVGTVWDRNVAYCDDARLIVHARGAPPDIPRF